MTNDEWRMTRFRHKAVYVHDHVHVHDHDHEHVLVDVNVIVAVVGCQPALLRDGSPLSMSLSLTGLASSRLCVFALGLGISVILLALPT
jgi:hypothetical protein